MGFLGQLLLAILAGFGLFALAEPLLALHPMIASWVAGWKSTTHGAWDLLFSSMNFTLPVWAKDYLNMGVISLAMMAHAILIKDYKIKASNFFLAPLNILIWPFFYGNVFAWLMGGSKDGVMLVYFESLFFALVILAINYALVFSIADLLLG